MASIDATNWQPGTINNTPELVNKLMIIAQKLSDLETLVDRLETKKAYFDNPMAVSSQFTKAYKLFQTLNRTRDIFLNRKLVLRNSGIGTFDHSGVSKNKILDVNSFRERMQTSSRKIRNLCSSKDIGAVKEELLFVRDHNSDSDFSEANTLSTQNGATYNSRSSFISDSYAGEKVRIRRSSISGLKSRKGAEVCGYSKIKSAVTIPYSSAFSSDKNSLGDGVAVYVNKRHDPKALGDGADTMPEKVEKMDDSSSSSLLKDSLDNESKDVVIKNDKKQSTSWKLQNPAISTSTNPANNDLRIFGENSASAGLSSSTNYLTNLDKEMLIAELQKQEETIQELKEICRTCQNEVRRMNVAKKCYRNQRGIFPTKSTGKKIGNIRPNVVPMNDTKSNRTVSNSVYHTSRTLTSSGYYPNSSACSLWKDQIIGKLKATKNNTPMDLFKEWLCKLFSAVKKYCLLLCCRCI